MHAIGPISFFMKSHLPLIAAILSLPLAVSAAPRLVVSTPSLVPESQIDLVLDSPAVAISELGKTTDNTWLDVQPALPGTLRWKAQNIAQFTPAQAPAIGTTYTFSISKNHTHLDQSAVPAGKFATLASEPFRVITANPPNRWSADYVPSTGAWLIVFNDDVDPAAAAAFVSFSSNSGQRVAARLERATVKRGGKGGATGVGDLGVAEVERLELRQHSRRRRRRTCRRRRRHEGGEALVAERVALKTEMLQRGQPPQGRREGHQRRVADAGLDQQLLDQRQLIGPHVLAVAQVNERRLLALDLAARLDDLATLVRFEAIAKERDAWLEGAEGTAVELVGETDVGVGFFVTKLAKT